MWDGIYHGMLRRVSTWWAFRTVRKTTHIRIKTDRLLIIQRRHSTRSWCPECGREVDVIRAEEAAVLTGTPQFTLRNSVADEEWHVSYSPSGSRLICLDSLLKSL
jgi:hypothetical protein